jgi:hypothetical protein
MMRSSLTLFERNRMLERVYQADLIHKLKKIFPGCIVLKNDSGYTQGIPDLLILVGDKWAMLEVKTSPSSEKRPNQVYFVEKLNEMSYAAFIYPENEEEVIHDLQQALASGWTARVSEC